MGVRGLEKFMNQECAGAQHNPLSPVVDLKILFADQRRNGVEIVVVEGQACVNRIFGSVDWVCGGQLKQYGEVIERFVNAFREQGVKLVFFYSTHLTKSVGRKDWLQWRCDSVYKVRSIYDKIIQDGMPPGRIDDKIFYRPKAALELASYFMQKLGCDVYKESSGPLDANVAKFAQRNNCFAVLGQDSDLIFYEGIEYYFSMKYLDLDNMTTVHYNRFGLARYLGLDENLLLLLPPLLGNDEVPEDLLSGLWKWVTNGRIVRSNVIKKTASFLQSICTSRNRLELIPIICKKVFYSTEYLPNFHAVLKRYEVNQPENTDSPIPFGVWERIQKESENLMGTDEVHPSIYGVLHGLPFELRSSLEDFRNTTIPQVGVLFRPLRRRLYGLLLHERPPGEGDQQQLVVGEWYFDSEEAPREPAQVSPVPVPAELHPGLLALWDADEELQDDRWRLLAWAVSPSGRLDEARMALVRALPPTLVVPALLLSYLLHESSPPPVRDWEVAAFIAQAVLLPGKTTEYLAGIEIDTYSAQAVQLANAFMIGSFHLRLLVEACGCPIEHDAVFPVHYFDGKFFHSLYLNAKSDYITCIEEWQGNELFDLMRQIIFEN